jgi:antitoxin component YwqK of YwqJK toxin-antitoxin module
MTTSPIPDHALEVIRDTWESGSKKRAVYLIDGQEIGCRLWDESGLPEMEYGLRDGLIHGAFRTWVGDGQLSEEATYVDGKEHGESHQYQDGVCIGTYTMVHGTGLDLWCSAPGILAEERAMRDGQRHGFERWWSGDNQTIYEESHFHHGTEHGIFRQWNRQGRLSRGYPRYYVNGQRVAKRQYLRACLTDPTLPPFDAADNDPHRPLPPGVQPIESVR